MNVILDKHKFLLNHAQHVSAVRPKSGTSSQKHTNRSGITLIESFPIQYRCISFPIFWASNLVNCASGIYNDTWASVGIITLYFVAYTVVLMCLLMAVRPKYVAHD
jgi:hypothetical protein